MAARRGAGHAAPAGLDPVLVGAPALGSALAGAGDARPLLAGGGGPGADRLAAGAPAGAGDLADARSPRSGGVDLERGRIALGRHELDPARDALAAPGRDRDSGARPDAPAGLAGMDRAAAGAVLPAVLRCPPRLDGQPDLLRAADGHGAAVRPVLGLAPADRGAARDERGGGPRGGPAWPGDPVPGRRALAPAGGAGGGGVADWSAGELGMGGPPAAAGF